MLVRISDEEAAAMTYQLGELNTPYPRRMTRGWFCEERDVKAWRLIRFVSLPAPDSQHTSGSEQ